MLFSLSFSLTLSCLLLPIVFELNNKAITCIFKRVYYIVGLYNFKANLLITIYIVQQTLTFHNILSVLLLFFCNAYSNTVILPTNFFSDRWRKKKMFECIVKGKWNIHKLTSWVDCSKFTSSKQSNMNSLKSIVSFSKFN